jgi:nucleoside-diphosphate-sugar epimerase
MKKNKKLKVLVTGSSGFIGSKLCTALTVLGHEVVYFDRLIGSKFDLLPEVDLIYHMAAQTDVQYSMTHIVEDMHDNLILTGKMLERYPNTKIIYPASASSVDIQSPYGLSKKTACEYIKLMHKDYVIIMFPNIYGPGGKGVINVWQKSDLITIRGTGEQTRTIVHVDDVVRALILGMDWGKGEYQLGGQVLSLNEIAKIIDKPIVHDEAFKGEIFASFSQT